MKLFLKIVILIAIVMLVFWLTSYGDWHLKRNKHNRLPTGQLSLNEEGNYSDEKNRVWKLQPHFKNTFHQPDLVPIPPGVPIPYPNVLPQIKYDPYHPNLKFLSLKKDGSSYEAILLPDGNYLLEGKKQGTYNYSSPENFLGYIFHAFADVIPHLFNSNYDDSLNAQTNK